MISFIKYKLFVKQNSKTGDKSPYAIKLSVNHHGLFPCEHVMYITQLRIAMLFVIVIYKKFASFYSIDEMSPIK